MNLHTVPLPTLTFTSNTLLVRLKVRVVLSCVICLAETMEPTRESVIREGNGPGVSFLSGDGC